MTLDWGGQTLELRPERALYLPRHGALLVADFHLGKAHAFRRLGAPVPGGTTQDNLERLTAVLSRTGASHLVFLGDFLHAPSVQRSPALAAFAVWRSALPALRITLVRGNHDDRAGDPPAALGFGVADEPLELGRPREPDGSDSRHGQHAPDGSDGPIAPGSLALCHHPRRIAGAHVLAGHLHPGTTVFGRARDRLRLPCFHVMPDLLVLPAFGAFTGLHGVSRDDGGRRYAVDGERVVAVP